DHDVAEDAPAGPPREALELPVRIAVVREEACEVPRVADVLLERQHDRAREHHREHAEARGPGLGGIATPAPGSGRLGFRAGGIGLAIDRAPLVDADGPEPADDHGSRAGSGGAIRSAAWRSRRRVSSLPRTSIVSNSGGEARRAVIASRSSV